MKYIIVLFILIAPLLIRAQGDSNRTADTVYKGIRFERTSNWQEIQAEAKKEKKYILVDCYATWCVPCKYMKKEVFTDERLGDFINSKFISVEMQMDTSKADDETIKRWYADAGVIRHEYNVNAFPTYLFYSPDGEIVHKDIGEKQIDDFISLATAALDSNKQYYTLMKKYREGDLPYDKMPYLANMAATLDDMSMARNVAKFFIHDYLDNLSDDELCTKKNLEYIGLFKGVLSSKNRCFDLFYKDSVKVNKMMGNNYSQTVVCYVITKEEINPVLWPGGKPDKTVGNKPNWRFLTNKIRRKYDAAYADRTVLDAKLKWDEINRQWPDYCKNVIKKCENYGPYNRHFPNMPWGLDVNLNTCAWDLFLHSDKKNELVKALAWSDNSIKLSAAPNPFYEDTNANLLYKLGRVKDALDKEKSAAELAPAYKNIQDNFKKMQNGDPTWSVSE